MQEVFLAPRIASDSRGKRSIVGMRTKDVRRQRLLELKQQHGYRYIAEKIIEYRKRTGRHTKKGKKEYLDRYLSQLGTETDGRGIGNRIAADIEGAFGKHKGWMDRLGASSAEVNELLHIWGQFPEDEQRRILTEMRLRLRAYKDEQSLRGPDDSGPRPPPKRLS